MQSCLTTLLLLCSCFDILGGALGDVGTTRILHDCGSHNVDMMDLDKLSKRKFSTLRLSNHFSRPIKATKCYGDDQDQFPSDGHFAAVSGGIWDNGAACGRRYRMRCISGPRRPCRNRSIVVEVVDFCRYNPCSATMALPFKPLQPSQSQDSVNINVEYAQ